MGKARSYHPKRRRWPREMLARSVESNRDFDQGEINDIRLILSKDRWEKLQAFWGQRCAYCGSNERPLTKDHIVPRKRSGGTYLWNVVPACPWCNSDKSDADVFRWMTLRGYNYEAFTRKVKRQSEEIE